MRFVHTWWWASALGLRLVSPHARVGGAGTGNAACRALACRVGVETLEFLGILRHLEFVTLFAFQVGVEFESEKFGITQESIPRTILIRDQTGYVAQTFTASVRNPIEAVVVVHCFCHATFRRVVSTGEGFKPETTSSRSVGLECAGQAVLRVPCHCAPIVGAIRRYIPW